MKKRYWLQVLDLPYQEATRQQFIKVEREAGFFPKNGSGVATGGFISGSVTGTITSGNDRPKGASRRRLPRKKASKA